MPKRITHLPDTQAEEICQNQLQPQSESVLKKDSDPEQAQRERTKPKEFWHLLEKYFKRLYKPTNNNLRTSSNSRNKTEDTTPRDTVCKSVVQQNAGYSALNMQGILPLCKECGKQSANGKRHDEEIDEQELEAHYSFMAKIQEVLPEESSSTEQPLEQEESTVTPDSQQIYVIKINPGQLKEKSKVISDLKVKEEKDIDKMIEMDKQLKFLNEIVYTHNQSIQTIHMLAPKCSTYNGRPTFANPRYFDDQLGKELDKMKEKGDPCDLQKKTDSSQQGLEFLFSPLLEEYYNPAHGHAEDNNNDQAPNASFQEAEFINPFCTRVQEISESSSRNIDNTEVAFNIQPTKIMINDGTKDQTIEQVLEIQPFASLETDNSFATDPKMVYVRMLRRRKGSVDLDPPKKYTLLMESFVWIKTSSKSLLTLEQSQQGVSNDVLNHKLIADIEDDIMDPVMQCTTLPSHSGFSQQKLVSFVTEIHTLSIDISFQDR
ncbi:hypothetical protein Tco_0115124 [Tanacetum coccineum]